MRVVHCKKEKYDVYIGRPSKWGNPFVVGRDGDRTTVLGKFRNYLQENELLLQDVGELRGKTLGCWCAPLLCHGDILMELANESIAPEFWNALDAKLEVASGVPEKWKNK